MFSVYKTIHPPTGIDNAVYCYFINSHEQNLITTSANRLNVYRVVKEPSNSAKSKLEFVESYFLFGHISSIKACRYGNMSKDALAVAFADAKLSIVQYDSFTGDLNTLSIHYFEDELEREGAQYNIFPPILKVDPNMKCAVMLIYGFKLVVVPFYEEHSSIQSNTENVINKEQENSHINNLLINKSENSNQNEAISKNIASLSSYTIDLRKLDIWLEQRIIDIEFLYGYYEPTLFILCESTMTWVGRYSVKKDTCNSVALSLNLTQKIHPIIWPVDKLPSDCLKCHAVPQPIGGVLLFAVNSIIYINQSVPSYAISLNSFAKETSKYPFKSMENVKISLDSTQATFIDSNRMVLSLKGGEIYIITLQTDSESLRTVQNINFEKCPTSVISTCLTKCNENCLFIGSRLGNSVLLKYSTQEIEDELVAEGDENAKSEENTECVQEKKILSPINSDYDELDRLLELNHANKSEKKKAKAQNLVKHSFEICDVLLNIGPCGSSIVGESVGDYTEYSTPQNSNIDLVTSSGHQLNGCISILQRSLRPEIIATFQIQDIVDLWSVCNDESKLDKEEENDEEKEEEKKEEEEENMEHDDAHENEHNSENSKEKTLHTYLFLSKLDSTVVLQMGAEITELEKDSTEFCTQLPTLYCTNLSENKFILQITTNTFNLYSTMSSLDSEQPKLLKQFQLINYLDSKIKSATSLDSFICVLTENDTCLVFSFDRENLEFKFLNDLNSLSAFLSTQIACISLYKDTNGLFADNSLTRENMNDSCVKNESMNVDESFNSCKNNIETELTDEDEEDELLYGPGGLASVKTVDFPSQTDIDKLLSNDSVQKAPSISKTNQETNQNNEIIDDTLKKPNYFLLCVNTDGNLYVINLNEKCPSLVYTFTKFSQCLKTLIPSKNDLPSNTNLNQQVSQNTTARLSSLIDSNQNSQVQVHEILMHSFSSYDRTKSYLIAKMDDDLIIYEAFKTQNSKSQSQVHFKRVQHEIVIRDKRTQTKRAKTQIKKQNSDTSDLNEALFSTRLKNVSSLRPFDNGIAGYSGFAVVNCAYSYLVFFCPRSGLSAHPIWTDGQLTAFTSFKNSSITLSGFIYMNKNYDIRISSLPMEDGKLPINYDSSWVFKKVQIRQTVHYLLYHDESKTYAVVSSLNETTNKFYHLSTGHGEEDKHEPEILERDENFILPQRNRFIIQLYTANEWEPLPLGKYELADCEHVTTFKLVNLPYEGHTSGYRSFMAVSTMYCYNEEISARGRIIMFDVIETVPEPGQPMTGIKMKTIYEKEQKGPVSCLETVNGYLVACVGQKVFLYEYANNDLIGKAFIDANFYIHKMYALKNVVLVGDLSHGLSLMRFQKDHTKLSYVAKDKHKLDIYTCDYLVDNANLAFLASDSEKNISIYAYSSESHDNQGGCWLIRKGEFNVGSHINSMFRLKCKVNDPASDKRSALADKRHVTYCTNLDGGIGYVIPISEKTFRRLFILQNAIYVMIPHYAGLNPKSFRSWRCKRKELIAPQKNILDGDLLFEFFNLSFAERNEIAKKIKTSCEQLLDDLTEIFQFTCHF